MIKEEFDNLREDLKRTQIDLEAALDELSRRGVAVRRLSPWYRSAPVPASDQPWYVNGVAEIQTALSADPLLAVLHEVERDFGRVRTVQNAPRIIDLDLLDFQGKTAVGGPGRAILPHPRMTARAFVLRPLADLAPAWRHPVAGTPIQALLAALPAILAAIGMTALARTFSGVPIHDDT